MDNSTKKLMFSSKSPSWGTPQDFYDRLTRKFYKFTLDAAASKLSAKCDLFFTKEDNALSKDWSGHNVFLNPPYGRQLKFWVQKAYEEGMKDDTTVTMLIPARTDTKYFHQFCMKAKEIIFIKGRLRFVDMDALVYGDEQKDFPAPFPSMVVHFDGSWNIPRFSTMDNR
jgi:site-specific DNA-methyltransferase (adenine-specific)